MQGYIVEKPIALLPGEYGLWVYRGFLKMQIRGIDRQLLVPAKDTYLSASILHFYFPFGNSDDDLPFIARVDIKGRAEDGSADGARVYDKRAAVPMDIEISFAMQGHFPAGGGEAGVKIQSGIIMQQDLAAIG